MMSILSSRELNQNVSHAKRLSQQAPVFITDRGEPAYVLLSYLQYRQLVGQRKSNADRLAMSADDLMQIDEDFDFERAIFTERQVEL